MVVVLLPHCGQQIILRPTHPTSLSSFPLFHRPSKAPRRLLQSMCCSSARRTSLRNSTATPCSERHAGRGEASSVLGVRRKWEPAFTWMWVVVVTSLRFPHLHSHTRSLTLTHTHSHTHSLTHSLNHTHSLTLTHLHSLTLTLTHSLTHSLTRSPSLTHTLVWRTT